MNRLILLSVLFSIVNSVNFSFEPIHNSVPSFLEYISSPNRHDYIVIASNPGLSVNQINQKLKNWSEKVDVKDSFDEFLANFTATQEEFDNKLYAVTENLRELRSQITDVLKNGDKTKVQQREVIAQWRNTYEQEMDFLYYIAKEIGHEYFANELLPKKYYVQPQLN